MTLRKLLSTVLIVLPCLTIMGEQSIVPDDIANKVEFRLASRFLNDYAELLRTNKSDKTADIIRRTKEDGLKYSVGSDAILKSINGSEDFSMQLSEMYYNAEWSRNGKVVVSCSFPANIGLLTLSNKIELETKMQQDLSTASLHKVDIPAQNQPTSGLQPVQYSDLYLSDRGYYVTPKLSNQIVYRPIDDDAEMCSILIDPEKYPLETLSNMMLTGYSTHDLTMDMVISKYGYKTSSVSLSMGSLFNLFSADGSTPYWGVDTFDNDAVNGIYVWINNYGGYAHVMTVNVPIRAIKSDETAKVRLHCYVRLDNLKSMFEEYSQK